MARSSPRPLSAIASSAIKKFRVSATLRMTDAPPPRGLGSRNSHFYRPNAEVLTGAASAIAVGKRRRCTSRSQSGGPQPTGDRERNRPPVAPELGKQTRAEGQEMTPALYTAGASRPSVGTRPGSSGKRAFVDSRASTVAANDQAEAEVRGAESWLLQRRPGGTLGEAPALSTIRQRPLGFNDARAVGKEVCANRAASTCSSPIRGRVGARIVCAC